MHPLVDAGLTWTLPCNSHPGPLLACCCATARYNHDIISHLTHIILVLTAPTLTKKMKPYFWLCSSNRAATLLYNDDGYTMVWSAGLYPQDPPGYVQNYARNKRQAK